MLRAASLQAMESSVMHWHTYALCNHQDVGAEVVIVWVGTSGVFSWSSMEREGGGHL